MEIIVVTAKDDIVQCYCDFYGVYWGYSYISYSAMLRCFSVDYLGYSNSRYCEMLLCFMDFLG